MYVFNIMADSKHKFGTKMNLFLLTYSVSLGYICLSQLKPLIRFGDLSSDTSNTPPYHSVTFLLILLFLTTSFVLCSLIYLCFSIAYFANNFDPDQTDTRGAV